MELLTKLKSNTQHKDLINNFDNFHEEYTPEKLANLHSWPNDSDYEYLPTIEELLETITPEQMSQTHPCRMRASQILSSEESQDGYDRPKWMATTGDKQCKENLSIINGTGDMKGFRQKDALSLQVILRPNNGSFQTVVPVKWMGNGRLHMFLLSTKGVDGWIKVDVTFHKPNLTYKQMLSVEADLHSTDAGLRSSQNEKQKFISNFKAGKEFETYTFDYLKDRKLEYGKDKINEKGVLETYGIEGAGKYLSITSLKGIKDGKGNGFFKKYGEDNVTMAIECVKKLAKLTGEKTVTSTPVECLALMFHIFTKYGKEQGHSGFYSAPELQQYFIRYVENNISSDNMFGDSDDFKLSKMSSSADMKNIVFICVEKFWPSIRAYHSNLKRNKNKFGVDSYAVQQLLNFSKDRFLKPIIRNMLIMNK